MGLLDFLRKKTRGVLTAVEPQAGVAPASVDDVKGRLLGITGKGIQTGEDEGDVVVSWSAKIASAGVDGAEYDYLYRALRVSLDPGDTAASGLCFRTATHAEFDAGGLAASKNWERGQHVGSERVHVLAWLGPHRVEGGADEKGYRFSWSQLRDPVIEAVTGAGWTYKPERF